MSGTGDEDLDALFNAADARATLLDLHRARAEASRARADRKKALQQLSDAVERLDTMLALDAKREAPAIQRREPSGLREATAVGVFSDWHVEEVVAPETVNFENAYDPEEATRRAQRAAAAYVWTVQHHRSRFEIKDLVLMLLGDFITGYIHEELMETAAMSPIKASMLAEDLLTAAIQRILDELQPDTLTVPCTYGNHGRTTVKTRHATGAYNSYEWLMYHHLARRFDKDERVRFCIPEGPVGYVTVYDRDLRFTHGDRFRYTDGVGGLTIPLNKKIAKWDTHRAAYFTSIGHYHTYMSLPNALVNGSLIGTTVYSGDFPLEAPVQAFCLIDSKRGRCMSTPLWVT